MVKLNSTIVVACFVLIAGGFVHGQDHEHRHTAHDHPTDEQLAALAQSGELADRLAFMEWCKPHRIGAGVREFAAYKFKRDQLVASGREDLIALLHSGPQPAFPAGIRPELRSQGQVQTLTLLIDFDGARAASLMPGLTADRIRANIYGEGTDNSRRFKPYESLAAYYDRASEGKVEIQGTVLGWYGLSHSQSHYTVERLPEESLSDFQTRWNQTIFEMTSEALASFDATHDFARYDNDSDGDIDAITILYAGDRGDWATFWWAYRWEFLPRIAAARKFDGKSLKQFVFQYVDLREDNVESSPDFDPRTLMHEMGHAFGLPDYYDYTPSNRGGTGPDGGVGGLDMMDANRGNHNAFSRWLLDWIDPVVVGNGGSTQHELVGAGASGVAGAKAIAVYPGLENSSVPSNEMFLIEYRPRAGNDESEQGEGCLIWHVDASIDPRKQDFIFDNSYTARKLLRLVRNGRLADFHSGEHAGPGDYFTPGSAFSPDSTPPSTGYAGHTGVVIADLVPNGNSIRLNVGLDENRPSPIAPTAASPQESAWSRLALSHVAPRQEKFDYRLVEEFALEANAATVEELAAMWAALRGNRDNVHGPAVTRIIASALASKNCAKALDLVGRSELESSEIASILPSIHAAWQASGNTERSEIETAANWQLMVASAFEEDSSGRLVRGTDDLLERVVTASRTIGANTDLESLQHAVWPEPEAGINSPGVLTAINLAAEGRVELIRRIEKLETEVDRLRSVLDQPRPLDSVAGMIDVISYNVESGDADPDVISEEIASMDGVDLWGFSEVLDESWTEQFMQAAAEGENASFQAIHGTTGGSDRLAAVYNETIFEYVDDFEIHEINPRVDGRRKVRSALVVNLRIRATGQEFYFMVNHLYRTDLEARHRQAQVLNRWIAAQTIPVLAVGDYNFDWELPEGDEDHDLGFDYMVADGAVDWIRPNPMVKTHKGEQFNSILDFVFLGGPRTGIQGQSRVVVRPGDTPDNADISDHRPVFASIRFPDFIVGPDNTGPRNAQRLEATALPSMSAERRALLEAENAARSAAGLD